MLDRQLPIFNSWANDLDTANAARQGPEKGKFSRERPKQPHPLPGGRVFEGMGWKPFMDLSGGIRALPN
jgi:hypothetical protein